MSKIQDKVDKTFDQYPTASKVFATADGKVFLRENCAKLHAAGLKDKSVTTYVKEITSEGLQKEYTVKDLELFAKDSSDIPVLEELLEAEKVGANRKGAISALETRIKTLKENA